MVKLRARLFIILMILCPILAFAQSDVGLEAYLEDTTLGLQDSTLLKVSVRGAGRQVSQPKLPSTDAVQFTLRGQTSQFTSTPQGTETVRSFTYMVTPLKTGKHNLGSVELRIQGRTYYSAELKLTIKPQNNSQPSTGQQARPQSSRQSTRPSQPSPPTSSPYTFSFPFSLADPADDFKVESATNQTEVYQGQQLRHTLKLTAYDSMIQNPTYFPLQTQGFIAESLGSDTYEGYSSDRGSGQVMESRTAIFPLQTGTVTVPGSQVSVLPSRSLHPLELSSDPITLNVKPLPPNSTQDPFWGAIGTAFTLEQKVSKKSLKAYEPFEWTITVKGNGHPDLIQLEPFKAPQGFNLGAIETEVERNSDFTQFSMTKTFHVSVTINEPGEYTLPVLSMAYFHPRKQEYLTTKTPTTENLYIKPSNQKPSSSNQTIPKDLPGERHYSHNWQYYKLPLIFIFLSQVILLGLTIIKLNSSWFSQKIQEIKELWKQQAKPQPTLTELDTVTSYSALKAQIKSIVLSRFQKVTPGSTYSELEQQLKQYSVDSEVIEDLISLLKSLDRIQYRNDSTDPPNLEELKITAKETLERMHPHD